MTNPKVAYFCMEFGLSADFPIYSGGLGILAGDHMKSAGDLDLPVIGIGMFWSEGYVRQTLGKNGAVEDRFVPTPRDAVTDIGVEISVNILGEDVRLRALKVNRYIKSELYLLEPVLPEQAWLAKRLYIGSAEDRVAQEMALGIGGVRLLRAMGRTVDVYHFNEGHAVLAGIELLRELMTTGQTFDEAWKTVRQKIVFTTHTPVVAGNETHGLALLRRLGACLHLSDAEMKKLGDDPFGMTVAGLRLSRKANGVAQLHGEVAKAMWHDVKGAAPIFAITNGVHAPTWQDSQLAAIAQAEGKKTESEKNGEKLWQRHGQLKAALIADIEQRTKVQLHPDKLLVGFARRATGYKRADLILTDEKAFAELTEKHGVQLVFSGKAHPHDEEGKEMIGRIVTMSKKFPKNLVFLEDYNMTLGASLTRGADVWLNNPQRPKEASGTSGMKAAMNGVLNLSILDGWWPEGCVHGVTGWAFGTGKDLVVELTPAQLAERNREDRASLYKVLSSEVLPTFADSKRWSKMMLASIEMSEKFSSDRMVKEYFERLYPA